MRPTWQGHPQQRTRSQGSLYGSNLPGADITNARNNLTCCDGAGDSSLDC
jgi:hypothetical protein